MTTPDGHDDYREPGLGDRLAEPLLVAVGALAVLVVAYNRSLLPAYYFNDDKTLRTDMAAHPHISTSNSFSTAAFVFNTLGLRDASTAVGFISFGLSMAGVVLARRATAVRALTLGDTFVYGFAIMMGAVYLGQLSKEPFVLIVILGFLVLARHRVGEVVWAVFLVIPLALYLRPYWALVGLFYVAFRLWFSRRRSMWHLAYLSTGALLILSVAVHVVLGKASVVSFRTDVQQDLTTLYGSANTAIKDYLPTTGLGFGWADAVLSLFLLLVPIPLVLLGGAQYLVTGLVISGLWYRFFRVVRSYSGRFSTMPPLALRSVFLTISFISIQAIFEPDYGSFLRHLTDLMPVFLVVIGTGTATTARTPAAGLRPATSHRAAKGTASRGTTSRGTASRGSARRREPARPRTDLLPAVAAPAVSTAGGAAAAGSSPGPGRERRPRPGPGTGP